MDNEQWLNSYEARDMEIVVSETTMQSGPLNKAKDIFKALQWLSVSGVRVVQFKGNEEQAIIQVEPNNIITNPYDLHGCKVVFK